MKHNKTTSNHSTGPKTESGKQKSSLNALSHGLTAQIAVMPNEDRKAYQSHLESFLNAYHPQDPIESHLVQTLVDTSWRLNRVVALECSVLALPLEAQIKALTNLSLHTQRLTRRFERTVVQLRELQHTRKSRENLELETLLEITDMYEAKGEPYDPAEDGFVFTESQIDDAIRARNRRTLGYDAADFKELNG